MRAGNRVTAASSGETYDVAEVRASHMQVSLEEVMFRLKSKNKPGKCAVYWQPHHGGLVRGDARRRRGARQPHAGEFGRGQV